MVNIYQALKNILIVLKFISNSAFAINCYKCDGEEDCANLDDTKVLECPNTDDGCIWRFEDCKSIADCSL